MNQNEVSASVDLIKALLSKRPSGTITGALLGELIRREIPGLKLKQLYPAGQKTLSRFIREYCSDFLAPLQPKGGDILYSITPDASGGVHPESPANEFSRGVNYDLWLAFARPNSASSVFIDSEKKMLSVGANKTPSEGCLKVQSITPDELASIRREFIEGLEPNEYEPSIYLIEGSYSNWLENVRSCGGKLFNNWSLFRITKLHDLFRSRLEALDLDGDQLQFFCEVMKQSQERPPRKAPIRKDNGDLHGNKPSSKIYYPAQEPNSDTVSLSSEEAFRDVVIEAVRRMSLTEMRALNIPAGLFMDSVNSILRK